MDATFRLGLLKKLYDRLFASGTTVSTLRNATISERLFPGSTDSINVVGRSLAWKLFLAKEEPLQASLPARANALLESFSESRQKFEVLLAEKLRAPDGNPKSHRKQQGGDLDLNNPLSLHDENPWNDWFAGVELRKVISQDVERTFPDIDFYREREVQEQLTNILFLYSIMHPSIGYRQGMHELLAPLYYAVRYDAINSNEIQDAQYKILTDLCSPAFTAADSWALFDTVMNSVHKWYEWRESVESLSSFSSHVIDPGRPSPNGILPYVAPIVQACNHIQSNLLRACDPILYQSMQKAGMEPQIYGIRWLRLLFTREFSMVDALQLWDGLFSCDPSLELTQWVCVAMLIRIRNHLIPVDYSTQLTTLLRYPTSLSLPIDGAPHHAILLIRQALALQVSPNPETGATIVMENRTLLGIPVEVPFAAIPTASGRPNPDDGWTLVNGPGRNTRQQASPSVTISDFTRSLVERGENLGINKTLMNAVTEIRRNIPELAASLGVKAGNQVSALPLVDERPVDEHRAWEPRTRFEVEKELTVLRARDKTLGKTLAWVVDSLLQDESGTQDEERLKLQKREALESLSYVRDVLMMGSMDLDGDRLMGTEERARRKLKAGKEREIRLAPAAAIISRPPPSVMDSRQLHPARVVRSRSPPVSSTLATRSSFHSRTNSHTRSSFSVSPEVIPRHPPPTSTGAQKGDVRLLPKPNEYMDPLGAMR